MTSFIPDEPFPPIDGVSPLTEEEASSLTPEALLKRPLKDRIGLKFDCEVGRKIEFIRNRNKLILTALADPNSPQRRWFDQHRTPTSREEAKRSISSVEHDIGPFIGLIKIPLKWATVETEFSHEGKTYRKKIKQWTEKKSKEKSDYPISTMIRLNSFINLSDHPYASEFRERHLFSILQSAGVVQMADPRIRDLTAELGSYSNRSPFDFLFPIGDTKRTELTEEELFEIVGRFDLATKRETNPISKEKVYQALIKGYKKVELKTDWASLYQDEETATLGNHSFSTLTFNNRRPEREFLDLYYKNLSRAINLVFEKVKTQEIVLLGGWDVRPSNQKGSFCFLLPVPALFAHIRAIPNSLDREIESYEEKRRARQKMIERGQLSRFAGLKPYNRMMFERFRAKHLSYKASAEDADKRAKEDLKEHLNSEPLDEGKRDRSYRIEKARYIKRLLKKQKETGVPARILNWSWCLEDWKRRGRSLPDDLTEDREEIEEREAFMKHYFSSSVSINVMDILKFHGKLYKEEDLKGLDLWETSLKVLDSIIKGYEEKTTHSYDMQQLVNARRFGNLSKDEYDQKVTQLKRAESRGDEKRLSMAFWGPGGRDGEPSPVKVNPHLQQIQQRQRRKEEQFERDMKTYRDLLEKGKGDEAKEFFRQNCIR